MTKRMTLPRVDFLGEQRRFDGLERFVYLEKPGKNNYLEIPSKQKNAKNKYMMKTLTVK